MHKNSIAAKQPMNDSVKKMMRSSGGPTAKQMQYVAAIARTLCISPGRIRTKLGAKRFINKWRDHYLEARAEEHPEYLDYCDEVKDRD